MTVGGNEGTATRFTIRQETTMLTLLEGTVTSCLSEVRPKRTTRTASGVTSATCVVSEATRTHL